MKREELLRQVSKILAEKLDVPIEDIDESSHIIDDLGADSLDVVDLVMILEDEYGIKIEDEELEQISTIEDLLNILEPKLKGREE
ncbi:acyl carrier protein [Thermosipho melanesiensis]|uniref:Acyl carrier protein n=2 Tax=Thermosipho melanesiensis TaxID=46541 RepID=A6LN81_THEM4|nr:acyl carrier protein [Thermosipho melanesiensis]ABR31382.1 phosphopantetheine-binding [Thermosipho melanesiensis BI429]APT74442.1 acyl carrier protein [Thermosipho melanesiensis]OOC36404.1 acyl carrier protein [Thermosipho melanesiensis]OOC37222.1 acyl carrier protein [Thermosipho melanesiensis]OOC37974.1 acyl carrier protein [Thermosipho melanesiensis]